MNKKLNFRNLNSDKDEEKYKFVKELVYISEKNPEVIYPHFSKITGLLNEDKVVFRWSGIKILGNLAGIDNDNKIIPVLSTLFDFLQTGNIITAKNTIDSLSKIALSKKELSDEIVSVLIHIDEFNFETPKHENIITSRVIAALTKLFPQSTMKEQIKKMAVKHVKRGRPDALKRAEELLKQIEKSRN